MVPIDSVHQGSASLTSSSSTYESNRIKELEAQVAELRSAASSPALKSSGSNSPATFDIDSYRENVRTQTTLYYPHPFSSVDLYSFCSFAYVHRF